MDTSTFVALWNGICSNITTLFTTAPFSYIFACWLFWIILKLVIGLIRGFNE